MDYITAVALLFGGVGVFATLTVALISRVRHRKFERDQPELPFHKSARA